MAPEDPAVLQLRAMVALRSGCPGDALQLACRSLGARPGHVPTLLLAARAALMTGAAAQALVWLREAVALAPTLAEPAFLWCRALAEVGDTSLDAALEDVARRFPAQAPAWRDLGVALQRSGRPTQALAAFTRAAAAEPALAPAHFGRGLLLRDAGALAEALAALRRAVALEPASSAAWFALGLTCQDLGDEAGAADAFQTALRKRSDFAEAAVNLGIARQRLGDMDAAIAAYRQAVRIRPDTFGRIAQAMTSASTGTLWLAPSALRRLLDA